MSVDEPPAASPLQSELAQQIVLLINQQGLQPGAPLPEIALAREFGVSRSPVRGALSLLATRGITTAVPRRGFVVAKPVADASPLLGSATRSTREVLYSTILADRSNGRIQAEVSEAELSQRYDTPRGTIRKILMRLAAEGLAQRQRGHGWRFIEGLDTPEVISESYEFRIGIECAALRGAKFRFDPAQMDQLRRMHGRIIEQGSAERQTWFRTNALFHELVVGWSNNRFFQGAMRQQNNLRQMTEYAAFDVISSARIRQSCDEHLRLLDAIEGGDMRLAEALMRAHLLAASRPDP